jgi:hypothetical protein
MTSDANPAAAPGKPPSRWGLYGPLVLVVLFLGVWGVVWWMGAQRAGAVLDGLIARESQRGRDWVCPERSISGFPFRIQVNCQRPQLIERGANGLRREASLKSLAIHGRITSPGHYIALLESPMTIRLDQDRDLTLRWANARASFRGSSTGFSDLSLEITSPEALLGVGEAGDERIQAKDLSLHFRRSPAEKPGSDLVIRIVDIVHPALNRAIGNPEPMTVELQATAPGLVLEPNRRFEDALEAWRLEKGEARIVLAKLSKGQAAIDLAGALGLDELRRPSGNLQGRARGIDQIMNGITRRMGLDFGGLLGRLGGGQGMPIALVFENGRMRFGPFNLLTLEPLY